MIQFHEYHHLPLEQIDDKKAEAKAKYRKLAFCMAGSVKPKLLTVTQESDLIERSKAGCDKSKTKLAEHYWRFLYGIASRVAKESRCPELTDDMFAKALEDFFASINKFDPEKNARLSTYLTWTIVGSVRTYALKNASAIERGKGSDERKATFQKNRLLKEFLKNNGRPASESEADVQCLANMCGVSTKALKRGFAGTTIRSIPAHHIEIVDPRSSQEDLTHIARTTKDFEDAFQNMKAKISPRDYKIVNTLRNEDISNVVVAKKYGITAERVGQIFRSAMKIMRTELETRGISSRADLT